MVENPWNDANAIIETIAWMKAEMPKGVKPSFVAGFDYIERKARDMGLDCQCFHEESQKIEDRLEELEADQRRVEDLREKIAEKIKRIVGIAKGEIHPPPQFHVGWEIRDLEDLVLWS